MVPARSGSKQIKDKNIKLLGKHPLMAYSIITAKQCKKIDRIFVSTDSKEYSNIAED